LSHGPDGSLVKFRSNLGALRPGLGGRSGKSGGTSQFLIALEHNNLVMPRSYVRDTLWGKMIDQVQKGERSPADVWRGGGGPPYLWGPTEKTREKAHKGTNNLRSGSVSVRRKKTRKEGQTEKDGTNSPKKIYLRVQGQ